MINSSRNPWPTIIKAGLVAGTIDITCALVQFYIRTNRNPVAVLKFVASGVFGKTTAYSGDAMMPVWGLLFHYAIAFIWTMIFFLACSKIKLLLKNWIASAVFYGIFVWAAMAFIVVPLSNTPKFPFNPVQAAIAAAILIVAIGLPVFPVSPINIIPGRMVTVETYREMALSFPGTVELPHFERTSFRVNKKIFTTLAEKEKIVMVKLSLNDQSVFCSFDKTIIYPVPGGWGQHGATFIGLQKIKKAMLMDALTCAYCNVAPKKLSEKFLGEGT